MSKKKFNPSGIIITSAKAAWDASEKLDSVMSFESWLTQKIIIYIAELLEEQNAQLALLVSRQRPNYSVQRTGGILGFFRRLWYGKPTRR